MINKLKLFLFAFLFVIFWLNLTYWSTPMDTTIKYQQIWLDSEVSIADPNYSITFLKWWWLKTDFLWYNKAVLAVEQDILFWWTPNWLPYIYFNWRYFHFQWFFKNYSVCSPVTWLNSDYPWNCVQYTIDTGWEWRQIFKSFFSTLINWNWVVYSYKNGGVGDSDHLEVCYSNASNSMCFFASCSSNWCSELINSQNYPSDFTFTKIPLDSIWPAPWQSQYWENIDNASWDFVEFNPTDQDYIDYFENTYWFNMSMCYVWTTRLDASYWEIWDTWTGQTSLFDMFSHIYNRLPASNWYEIIWRWVDFWLFNYDQWFETDHNPKFLLVWSPLAELWQKIYTGFSNPFVWNPAFIYFYMSDLTNNYNGGLQVWTQRYWPALASYCDLKINWSNSYPISTWTIQKVQDELNSNIWDDLWWNIEYQNPTQWFNWWTSWFWDNNPYTWSSDVNSTFSQFYANLTNLLSWINSSWNGIIPWYILFFFAFAILIRLLKK